MSLSVQTAELLSVCSIDLICDAVDDLTTNIIDSRFKSFQLKLFYHLEVLYIT